MSDLDRFGPPPDVPFDLELTAEQVGWFGATVGAVIVLLLWNAFVGNRRRGVRGMGRRAMG